MKHLLFALVSIVLLAGCSKKEEETKPSDVRDEAIGEFEGSGKIYDTQGILISTELVTLKTLKNTNDNDRIDFYEDGSLLFFGNKIKKVSNGVVFDVPKQSTDPDIPVEGDNGVVVGSTNYDGAYLSDKKELTFILKVYDEDETTHLGWIKVEASRK